MASVPEKLNFKLFPFNELKLCRHLRLEAVILEPQL